MTIASAQLTTARDATRRDLEDRAVRGTLVTVAGQATSLVLRFGANWTVAELLLPDALGLAGTVTALIIGLQMASDLGIQQSIIQHRRDDRRFLDTAFTIGLARGVLLLIAGVLIAWPAARWYGRPELLGLVPFAATTALLNSAVPTKFALLTRRLRITRMVAIELAAYAIGVTAMVAHAYVYRTVWALVIGAVVTAASKWLLAVVAVPGPMDRLHWEKTSAADLYRFGKWVFLSTFLVYLARHFDQLVIPKLEGMGVAGVYGIAWNLALTPLILGGSVTSHVLLPALSESSREGGDALARNFAGARDVVLPIHLLVVVGIALGSAPLLRIYKPVYADAAWMCQLLVFSVWFQYLQEAWSQALVAVGDTRSHAMANAVRVAVTIPAVLVGFRWLGVPGLIGGSVLGAACGNFFVSARVERLGPRVIRHEVRYLGGALLLGGGGAMLPHLLGRAGIDPLAPEIATFVAVEGTLALWVLARVLPFIRGREPTGRAGHAVADTGADANKLARSSHGKPR